MHWHIIDKTRSHSPNTSFFFPLAPISHLSSSWKIGLSQTWYTNEIFFIRNHTRSSILNINPTRSTGLWASIRKKEFEKVKNWNTSTSVSHFKAVVNSLFSISSSPRYDGLPYYIQYLMLTTPKISIRYFTSSPSLNLRPYTPNYNIWFFKILMIHLKKKEQKDDSCFRLTLYTVPDFIRNFGQSIGAYCMRWCIMIGRLYFSLALCILLDYSILVALATVTMTSSWTGCVVSHGRQ